MGVLLGKTKESGEGTADQQGSSVTDVYLVELDNIDSTINEAILVPGVPAPFSFHPTIAYSRVRDYSIKRRDNSLLFDLSVHYQTPDNNSGNDQENDDPTLDRPTMSLGQEDRDVVVTATKGSGRTTVDGLTNSAGEIFEVPPVIQRAAAVMTITKNYASSYDVLTTALAYIDTINNDTFLGVCPPRTARIVSVSPKSQLRNGVEYLEITFVIKVRPTWNLELLDIGGYYIESGEKKPFQDGAGNPFIGKLDGSGKKLADNTPAVFLPARQVYADATFSGLGLPSSLAGYKFV